MMLHFPFNLNYPPSKYIPNIFPQKKKTHTTPNTSTSQATSVAKTQSKLAMWIRQDTLARESMRSTWRSSTNPPRPKPNPPAIAGLMIRAVLSPESGRLFVRGRVGCSMLFLEQGSYEWTRFFSVKTGH